MSRYPSLTWQFVQDWATDNQVPDDAVMRDAEDNRKVIGFEHWHERVVLVQPVLTDGDPALTWGQLRDAIRADNRCLGTDLMRFANGRIVDLNHYEEDGVHYFYVQRVWG